MSSTYISPDPEHPKVPWEETPQHRAELLLDAHPWLGPDTLSATAIAITRENASFRSRWGRLIALADKFNAAICEQAACRNGCSYCCSMPTLIYRHEAVLLSRASGRAHVELPFRSHNQVIAETSLLQHQPCPFLAEEKCSVYEARPMICRLHNSLNGDSRDCDLSVPGKFTKPVTSFDPDLIEVAYHALVRGHQPRASWGTIHEFFPE